MLFIRLVPDLYFALIRWNVKTCLIVATHCHAHEPSRLPASLAEVVHFFVYKILNGGLQDGNAIWLGFFSLLYLHG